MKMREEFKKGIAVLGLTAAMALTGFTAQKSEEKRDMSKYNIDNNKYEDYLKSDVDKKVLDRLEKNVNRYEELISKSSLEQSEKEELKVIYNDFKDGMRSGFLAEFYLNNVFKEQLKSAYKVSKVETKYESEDEINIKLYDRFGNFKLMDKKDQVLPIKNAMHDIAMLQGLENKKTLSQNELKKYIKAYENMKGFSNIHFMKVGNEPLTYAEIDLDKDKGEERE